MKKVSLFIFSFVFTIGNILAQVGVDKPSFGFKAGANFVNLESTENISLGNSFNENGATGFHAGIVLEVPLIKKSGLMFEALYSAEGIADVDLAFVNMPIMYTYKILPGLRLQIGPQFKVKIDADVSINDGFEGEADNEALEEDINDFNFDAVAGLEYKFPIIGVFIQGRTIWGLSDLGEEELGKSQSVQLSVGYRF